MTTPYNNTYLCASEFLATSFFLRPVIDRYNRSTCPRSHSITIGIGDYYYYYGTMTEYRYQRVYYCVGRSIFYGRVVNILILFPSNI